MCLGAKRKTDKEALNNCPEIEKSSHAVVYGYIDPEKGLMLEVLGAGKQAPKYFYFKDPYEGRRITISISDVADVPFVWFEKLEPRFYKKYVPRIEKLKQYDVPEDLEKSREFEFLDGCREPGFPDYVRVLFFIEGLKPEECWVRITGLGDHVIIGKLLNQPYQNYGVNDGDTITFFTCEESEGKIVCVADFGEQKAAGSGSEEDTAPQETDAEPLKDNKTAADSNNSGSSNDIRIGVGKMDNKAEIGKRALAIVEAEAPILREVLIRRLMLSFGVNKSSAVSEATEKALKAVKIKSTKQKGIVFCWAANQDPKAYYGLRVSNERSGDGWRYYAWCWCV